MSRWLGIAALVGVLAPLALVWLPRGGAGAEFAAVRQGIPWLTLVVTAAVCLAAAVLAAIMGGLLASAVYLARPRGAGFWATAILIPFICPPLVWAMMQNYCYGPGGLLEQWCGDAWRPAIARLNRGHYSSTTLVLAQIYTPLAMLIIGRGLSRLHHAGLESAALHFRGMRRVRWIAAAVRREIGGAVLLAFALGLGNFAVPHVLQCDLYSLEVYDRMANYLDERGALMAAAPLLVLAMAAAALVAATDGSGAATSPQPQRASRTTSRRGAVAANSLLAVWTGVVVALPVVALVRECSSPARFFSAVKEAAPETENTVGIAFAAAALAALAGLATGVWVARFNRGWVNMLAGASLGVPPLILGLAYLRFYNRAWPIDLAFVGGTSILIVLGLAARGWPFATRIVFAGRRRLAPQWLEAAELARLGRWRTVRLITGPLLADHFATGAIIAFVLAASEVEISQMLCAPGSGTLALRLFTFLHFGPSHVAASLALLQLILVATPVLVYFLLSNRSLKIV